MGEGTAENGEGEREEDWAEPTARKTISEEGKEGKGQGRAAGWQGLGRRAGVGGDDVGEVARGVRRLDDVAAWRSGDVSGRVARYGVEAVADGQREIGSVRGSLGHGCAQELRVSRPPVNALRRDEQSPRGSGVEVPQAPSFSAGRAG